MATKPLGNLVDEFIEAFDASDIDRVADVVADDAHARTGTGPEQIFHELRLRSPWTSLVRADLDGDPVAVIWVPDDQGEQHPIGYVTFDRSGDEITSAGIHDSVPDRLDHQPDAGTLVATEPGIDGQVKDAESAHG